MISDLSSANCRENPNLRSAWPPHDKGWNLTDWGKIGTTPRTRTTAARPRRSTTSTGSGSRRRCGEKAPDKIREERDSKSGKETQNPGRRAKISEATMRERENERLDKFMRGFNQIMAPNKSNELDDKGPNQCDLSMFCSGIARIFDHAEYLISES